MKYYVGDIPVEDLVIVPALDLEVGDTATAELTAPDGTVTALTTSVDPEQGEVSVEWPALSPFESEGIHELRVTIEGGGRRMRLPLLPLVVQDDTTGWHTIDSLRDGWEDAPERDIDAWELLEIAKNDVLQFAPDLEVDQTIPANYKGAQKLHARNTWNAAHVSPSGDFGTDTFMLRPFPLDWAVKQMLRPRRGVGLVG